MGSTALSSASFKSCSSSSNRSKSLSGKLSNISQVKSTIKKYGKKRITKAIIIHRPQLSAQIAKMAIPGFGLLGYLFDTNHWEIILEISEMLYILISFGSDGIQSVVTHQLEQLFKRGTLKKKKVVTKSIVQDLHVQQKEYHMISWNCQNFVKQIYDSLQ